jgi:hypothetical protein
MTMLPAHQGSLPQKSDAQIVEELDQERQKMDGLIQKLDGINIQGKPAFTPQVQHRGSVE